MVGRRPASRVGTAASRGALALVVLAAPLAAVGCEGRSGSLVDGKKSERDEPFLGPAIVEIDLSKGLPEAPTSTLFGPVPGGTHADLIETLATLRDDEDHKGVFVKLGSASLPMARADEIGRLLDGIRDAGLPVVCHADGLGHGSLLLAARGCSRIWLSPAGGVESVGLAAQLVFAKGLFDKLGVGVDFLQVGKYKGASEPYTREEPSPEARESLEGTLRDLRKAWLAGLAEGRERDLEAVAEDGPHTAQAAKELGLIDELGFLDEARDAAKELAGAERTVRSFGGRAGESSGGLAEALRVLSGGDVAADEHVAVVRAVGAITMGPGGGVLGGGDGIDYLTLGRTLQRLADDESVRAVVLRIDSPGGSALASDLLWHELMELRSEKPLVVSVGGMAASGGYYLACAGHRIYAEPTSIVGSIGVVGGKFAIREPLAQVGINTVTIAAHPDPARAARASYLSPFDRWDDATRSKVQASMERIYGQFLDRIVEGRGMERAVVEASAEGRIFGGATAKDRRLVDELGGLADAIAYAREQSGLGSEGAVRLVGEQGGLLAMLSGGDQARAVGAAEAAGAAVRRELDPLRIAGDALGPDVVVWIGALSPAFASRETVLATTPFGLIVR